VGPDKRFALSGMTDMEVRRGSGADPEGPELQANLLSYPRERVRRKSLGMARYEALRQYLPGQAAFCRANGSPFSASVLEQMADGLGRGEPYDALFEPWADAPLRQIFTDAAPLRLLGAFHYLVLSDRAPDLKALYPPAGPDPDPCALGAAMADAAAAHSRIIQGFMASPPQTNEVARSLGLVGGFLTVAAKTGLPLRCLELGASAGLNMNWDLFGYSFGGGATWGDPGSPVQLNGDWTGGAPPRPSVQVIERLACDQAPIDVGDPDLALRLQSYVWADQSLRLARLRGAIALKQQTGGTPECADAADWTEAHVHPSPGAAAVVYHSVFLQYPPEAVQARIRAAISRAGAAATAQSPVGWLRMEPDPDNLSGPMDVRLTLWPGGEERLLARAHPHGAAVTWLD
jgi:hypothetical protein